jgi:hypothetical protein
MVDINVHFTGAPHPFYRVSPWLDLVAPEKDFSPTKAILERSFLRVLAVPSSENGCAASFFSVFSIEFRGHRHGQSQ